MMSKNNNEERKCKICGKTIVGKNKTGICSACKKKAGDTGVSIGKHEVIYGWFVPKSASNQVIFVFIEDY